jgi:hypothetical protein
LAFSRAAARCGHDSSVVSHVDDGKPGKEDQATAYMTMTYMAVATLVLEFIGLLAVTNFLS